VNWNLSALLEAAYVLNKTWQCACNKTQSTFTNVFANCRICRYFT